MCEHATVGPLCIGLAAHSLSELNYDFMDHWQYGLVYIHVYAVVMHAYV